MTVEEKIRLGIIAVTVGTSVVAAALGVSVSPLEMIGGHNS